MRAFKSISARMILAITLVAAGSCGVLAAFSMWQQQSIVDVALKRESQNDYVEGIAVLDGRMVTLLGMTKLTSSFGGGLDGLVDHAA